jgi:hypothetical protein
MKDIGRKSAKYQRDQRRECERERASVREGWRGYKDQDIHINTYGNII